MLLFAVLLPVLCATPADGGTTAGLAARPDAGAPSKPARAPLDPAVKALVDRVQAFYERTQDFTADFRQDYAYAAFKRTQTSTGKVSFRKPAMMRWEYQKPSARTFVLAGERVYAFDPEAMTLTKGHVNSNQLSASVTFLWGRGKLADEFAITFSPCDKCLGQVLDLVPLVPDPRFQRIRLEVDPKTAQVTRSTVTDPDGSQNAITFSNLATNVGVSEATFKLSPPPGTQIVDLTKDAPVPSQPAGR